MAGTELVEEVVCTKQSTFVRSVRGSYCVVLVLCCLLTFLTKEVGLPREELRWSH
jgi:hypothetical protein